MRHLLLILLEVLLKPGSPYCPVPRLSLSCLSVGCHVHTSGTFEDADRQRPDLNGPLLPKIFSHSFAKNFSEQMGMTSPQRRGPGGGHSPPAFARTTITKSPGEAVFIQSIYYVNIVFGFWQRKQKKGPFWTPPDCDSCPLIGVCVCCLHRDKD